MCACVEDMCRVQSHGISQGAVLNPIIYAIVMSAEWLLWCPMNNVT